MEVVFACGGSGGGGGDLNATRVYQLKIRERLPPPPPTRNRLFCFVYFHIFYFFIFFGRFLLVSVFLFKEYSRTHVIRILRGPRNLSELHDYSNYRSFHYMIGKFEGTGKFVRIT